MIKITLYQGQTHECVAVLDNLGWTDAMIRDALSESNKLGNNPHHPSAAPMRLLFIECVDAEEALDKART